MARSLSGLCLHVLVVLQGSGEQLDHLSGSVRPLLDISVLLRLSWLFDQGQGLLHCGLSCSSPQPLQVLQQHWELVIWNLRFMYKSHCHDLFHIKVVCERRWGHGYSCELPFQSQRCAAVTTSVWSSGTSTLCGFQPSCKDKCKLWVWIGNW